MVFSRLLQLVDGAGGRVGWNWMGLRPEAREVRLRFARQGWSRRWLSMLYISIAAGIERWKDMEEVAVLEWS